MNYSWIPSRMIMTTETHNNKQPNTASNRRNHVNSKNQNNPTTPQFIQRTATPAFLPIQNHQLLD